MSHVFIRLKILVSSKMLVVGEDKMIYFEVDDIKILNLI